MATLTETRSVQELQAICKKIRRDIVTMITAAKSGHPGGSLSAVELLVSLYFGGKMRHNPADPHWKDRDRFILGLSLGAGMALAARLDKSPTRVYVVLGDGEIQEGQVWEAAMFGAFHKIDNLVAIVDYNRIQLDGFVKDIMEVEPLADKWRAFGWHVIELDGHDLNAVNAAYDEAAATKGKPTALVAHTVKGKGVSFMENNPKFHGVAPTAEELEKALAELA